MIELKITIFRMFILKCSPPL